MDDIRRMEEETKRELDEVTGLEQVSIFFSAPSVNLENWDKMELIIK